MAYSELPWMPFLGHQAWTWTTLRRGNVFYYVYKRFFFKFCHVFCVFNVFYFYLNVFLHLWHWPCVTDFSGLFTYTGSWPTRTGNEHPADTPRAVWHTLLTGVALGTGGGWRGGASVLQHSCLYTDGLTVDRCAVRLYRESMNHVGPIYTMLYRCRVDEACVHGGELSSVQFGNST